MFKKILKSLSSVGLIFVVAFLGAFGGQRDKWVRRFILPAIVTIYSYFLLQNWWVLTIYFMSFPLSIGYGIPCYFGEGNANNDKGSALGRFFYKLFKQSELWANIMTRGTVGLLISLSMLSVPIITKNWVSYCVGSLIIGLVWGLVSWRGFGETKVKLFGKEISLLNVDLTTYAVTALGFVLIVNGWLK